MSKKPLLTELEESNLRHYGTTTVTPIPDHIVNERVALLEKRLKVLMSVHFMEQDNNAINGVLADIKFWKRRGEME